MEPEGWGVVGGTRVSKFFFFCGGGGGVIV